MRSRKTLALVLFMSLLGGSGAAFAGHLQGCAKQNYTWGTVHEGSNNQNHCSGGDGKDDMFGYGASDELHGGLSADTLRGAEGGDSLHDGQGAGDLDQVCLGDGPDVANVVDNDGKDYIYDTPQPDGWDEDLDGNWAMGDQVIGGSSCPVADPR